MNQYKDSLFRTWFNTKEGALELYNALHGTHYDDTVDIVINTLEESLWTKRKNDLSFLLNRKLIVLAEHQSTINENMPFRFLDPIRRLFEQQITDKKTLYQTSLVKLPRPEFLVIYNGSEIYPELNILRLSDAFESTEGFDEINMDISVKVYNINEGYNEAIKAQSERLKGYSFFVEQVRRYDLAERKRGTPKSEALIRGIRRAVQDCKDANLMRAFWQKISEEDIEMLQHEWDLNLALEVCGEENFEKGLQKGLQKGIYEGLQKGRQDILELMKQAHSLEDFKRLQAEIENWR